MTATGIAVQVGEAVLYYPHEDHALDGGGCYFHWHHHCPKDGKRQFREGQRLLTVGDGDLVHQGLLANGLQRDDAGQLQTRHGDHPVRPGPARQPWPATVLAVHEDGTADLDIRHPDGSRREYGRLAFTLTGQPHCWSLPT
jgi:hypothetical protein